MMMMGMMMMAAAVGVEGAIPSVTVGDIRVQALSPTLLRVECVRASASRSLAPSLPRSFLSPSLFAVPRRERD